MRSTHLPSSYHSYKSITEAPSSFFRNGSNNLQIPNLGMWKSSMSSISSLQSPSSTKFGDQHLLKAQFIIIWLLGLNWHKDCLLSKEILRDITKWAIKFVDLRRWLKVRDRESEIKQSTLWLVSFSDLLAIFALLIIFWNAHRPYKQHLNIINNSLPDLYSFFSLFS